MTPESNFLPIANEVKKTINSRDESEIRGMIDYIIDLKRRVKEPQDKEIVQKFKDELSQALDEIVGDREEAWEHVKDELIQMYEALKGRVNQNEKNAKRTAYAIIKNNENLTPHEIKERILSSQETNGGLLSEREFINIVSICEDIAEAQKTKQVRELTLANLKKDPQRNSSTISRDYLATTMDEFEEIMNQLEDIESELENSTSDKTNLKSAYKILREQAKKASIELGLGIDKVMKLNHQTKLSEDE